MHSGCVACKMTGAVHRTKHGPHDVVFSGSRDGPDTAPMRPSAEIIRHLIPVRRAEMYGLGPRHSERNGMERAHIVEMHIQTPLRVLPDIPTRALKPALRRLQPTRLILQKLRPGPRELAGSAEPVDAAISMAYLTLQRPDAHQRPERAQPSVTVRGQGACSHNLVSLNAARNPRKGPT